MVSSAFGEAEFWHYYRGLASLKNGKTDYSDARFGYIDVSVGNTGLTLTKENMNTSGTITFSGGRYSFWNGSEIQKVAGTPQTFRLAIPTWQAVGDEAGFDLLTDIGGKLRLGLEADGGMNGVTLSWNFPDMPSLNGTHTFPHFLTAQEQMNKHVVYFEFIRSGENVTGINWRVVKASDTSTPVELDYPVNFLRLRIWNYDEERIVDLKPSFYMEPGQTPEGILMFDDPIKESDIWRVMTKFYTYDEEIDKEYDWYYCTSTQSGLYLYDRHSSTAALVNGKSSYNNAKFSSIAFFIPNDGIVVCEARHLTDTGRITVTGGGYTINDADTLDTLSTVAAGQDMTFKLRNDGMASIGTTYVEYQPIGDNGRRIQFGGGADTGFNGKTISWTFPADLAGFNGRGVVHNYKSTAEQLNIGVPYVELVSEDGYITSVNYKIVTASNTSTAITPSYRTDFSFYIDRANTEDIESTRYSSGRIRNTASGTWTLDTPQPLSTMKRIRARLYRYEDSTDNPAVYQWTFNPASSDPAPSSNNNSSGGGCSTGFTFTALFLAASLFILKKH